MQKLRPACSSCKVCSRICASISGVCASISRVSLRMHNYNIHDGGISNYARCL